MTDRVGRTAPVQAELQAHRVYERALWQEQTAASLGDLEDALALYRQAEKRYPETVHGRLAEREARRVKPMVEKARAKTEASQPKRRPIAPIPPRLNLKTP